MNEDRILETGEALGEYVPILVEIATQELTRHWGDLHTNQSLGHQRAIAGHVVERLTSSIADYLEELADAGPDGGEVNPSDAILIRYGKGLLRSAAASVRGLAT